MYLSALEINQGERIALVGAGGKTGLAYRLVAEARQRGWTALLTTTTKLLPPLREDESFVVAEETTLSPHELGPRLRQQGRLFLASHRVAERDQVPVYRRGWVDPERAARAAPAGRRRKLAGFAPEEVDRLAQTLQPDLLVVEADGARHRPFKAPADYEPVIPGGITLVVVMAGLSVLGRPLNADGVHRPERVVALSGTPQGRPVGPALVATVLAHPQGGRKGVPPSARAIALLAQATAPRRPGGRQIARYLRQSGGWERVVLADLDAADTPVEVWMGPPGALRIERSGPVPPVHAVPLVHAVVLAAGEGRRMGQNKLLLPLGGKPLVAHTVDAALGSLATTVSVVLGVEAEAVRQTLGGRPVQYLYNRDWRAGQATSLQVAVAASPQGTAGALFLAGDMPFVPAAHLDRLIERFQGGPTVVWSGHPGRSRGGIPALLGRETFPALLELQGDVGGRALAGRFEEATVPVDAARQWLQDVDTPEAYVEAQQWLERQHR